MRRDASDVNAFGVVVVVVVLRDIAAGATPRSRETARMLNISQPR